MHGHSDDLAFYDRRIDGESTVHRAVDVLGDDDARLPVHLDFHHRRRIRDAIALVLWQVVRAETDTASRDDVGARRPGRRDARRPLRSVGCSLQDAEPARVRDVPFAKLIRVELGRMREIVHHAFQREERRGIQRRAQRTGSQVAGTGNAVVDDPAIWDVVHVHLRQVD